MSTHRRALRALALAGAIAALALPAAAAASPIDAQPLPAHTTHQQTTAPTAPADDGGVAWPAIAFAIGGAGLFAGLVVVIRRSRAHTRSPHATG